MARVAASRTVAEARIAGLRREVAIPGCLQLEVRPEFWTKACADAGWQLQELRFARWDRQQAVATATAAITVGPHRGARDAVRVLLDHPVFVPECGRRLFSRLVVTYLDGQGPDGTATETVDLRQMWEDLILFPAEVDPACPGMDGTTKMP